TLPVRGAESGVLPFGAYPAPLVPSSGATGRSGCRVRPVKPSAAAQPLPGKIAARLREAKWLALIAVATYLALVLATYDRADPGWSHSPVVDRVHNAGGRAGAWLADLALYVFGVSAWWWVVLLVYAVIWGYRRLDGTSLSDKRPFIIALAGFSVLLIASCGLEALRFYTIHASLPFAPGGMLGAVISEIFGGTFGFTGATLLLLAMAAIGLSLFSGVSWVAFMEGIGAAAGGCGLQVMEVRQRAAGAREAGRDGHGRGRPLGGGGEEARGEQGADPHRAPSARDSEVGARDPREAGAALPGPARHAAATARPARRAAA